MACSVIVYLKHFYFRLNVLNRKQSTESLNPSCNMDVRTNVVSKLSSVGAKTENRPFNQILTEEEALKFPPLNNTFDIVDEKASTVQLISKKQTLFFASLINSKHVN